LSSLTFLESRKIMLDFGLSAISILGILISLFLGVTVVGREIEKRTIYTVLAKPVSRGQYLLGKFLGAAVVALLVHVLNAVTLWLILLQLGEGMPHGFLAANYLMLLESWLVLALALCLSLLLSSLFLAASLALAFFLIGRSNHSLAVIAEKAESPLVRSLLRALKDVFPSLDRFNIRELVAYSKAYPAGMVPTSSLYFVAYLVLLLAGSILLLRRKDLS
jgi:ABC-type transport system involved in multi-copper enzyme maturation permease subunit